MNTALLDDARYASSDQPSAAQSYINAARRLCSGVAVLQESTAAPSLVCAFLAAESLECALKAYLSGLGFTINRLSHAPLGHDLETLWIEAATHGLDVPVKPPKWCSVLNREHGAEFPFRYPLDQLRTQYPGPQRIASALADVVAIVGKTV